MGDLEVAYLASYYPRAHERLGDTRAALAHLRRARGLARRQRSAALELWVREHEAQLLAASGRLDEAVETLEALSASTTVALDACQRSKLLNNAAWFRFGLAEADPTRRDEAERRCGASRRRHLLTECCPVPTGSQRSAEYRFALLGQV